MKTCFCHLNVVWRPLAEECLAISIQSIHRWKVHLEGYKSVADNTHLSSFVIIIASETREMSRNFKRIWPYNSSRSSKVTDPGVSGKPICDFLLVIVTLAVSATVFEIFTLKDRKLLILPTPLFDAPARGNPLEFLDETYPAKTRDVATVRWKFHNPNFNHFSMIHPSERRTDRQTDGQHIRAIARMLSRVKMTCTGWPIKVSRKQLSIYSSNIDRFSKLFCTWHILWKNL